MDYRLGTRRGSLAAKNREIRAVHPAQVAAATFLGSYNVGRVVAFRIESGGEGKSLGWAELDAESTTFTPLDIDRDVAFCHNVSTELQHARHH
jgi:hypothetical protein